MESDTPEPKNFNKEDDLQELMALVRAIKLANGATIICAQCEDANYRDTLIEQARRMYGGWTEEVYIPHGTERLIEYLNAIVPGHAAAVFVKGIEDWLSSGPVGETSRFVSTLNSSRNHFSKLIHCPIVFWAPSHILTTLLRGAPDFFSTVSAIYSFSRGDEKRISQAKVDTRNHEAEHREAELLALLSEHDSLPGEQQDEATRAVLLLGIGKSRRDTGRYVDAERPLQAALEIAERKFGLQNPDTATVLNELGVLYWLQGRYAEAESLYIRALGISGQALGADHPEIALILNNLAGLYREQDKHAEAEPLYVRALGIRRRTVGADHPEMAASLNNLAVLYESQERYAEAEPLYIRALEICEQALGVDHPSTATSLYNLAKLYISQGRYAEAEPLYTHALEVRRRALGDSHPLTRGNAHDLNELHRLQHRDKNKLT